MRKLGAAMGKTTPKRKGIDTLSNGPDALGYSAIAPQSLDGVKGLQQDIAVFRMGPSSDERHARRH
jgi:hypothetical protein